MPPRPPPTTIPSSSSVPAGSDRGAIIGLPITPPTMTIVPTTQPSPPSSSSPTPPPPPPPRQRRRQWHPPPPVKEVGQDWIPVEHLHGIFHSGGASCLVILQRSGGEWRHRLCHDRNSGGGGSKDGGSSWLAGNREGLGRRGREWRSCSPQTVIGCLLCL